MKAFFTILLFVLFYRPYKTQSSISPLKVHQDQILNLAFQIKGASELVKGQFTMPFYQIAEFEKKVDQKSILIEISPRHGKIPTEVILEMRFFRANSSRIFFKKELVAKLGQEVMFNFKGHRMLIRPSISGQI